MIDMKVGHYYRCTYTNNEYVALMCCHILEIREGDISIEGFTITRDGDIHKFSDGRATLYNRYRKVKEITETEYHTSLLLEQL